MAWEQELVEYGLWKFFVGIPGVIAWWWSFGVVGLSPFQYLDHVFDAYGRARRDFIARNPGHPLARTYPGVRYDVAATAVAMPRMNWWVDW